MRSLPRLFLLCALAGAGCGDDGPPRGHQPGPGGNSSGGSGGINGTGGSGGGQDAAASDDGGTLVFSGNVCVLVSLSPSNGLVCSVGRGALASTARVFLQSTGAGATPDPTTGAFSFEASQVGGVLVLDPGTSGSVVAAATYAVAGAPVQLYTLDQTLYSEVITQSQIVQQTDHGIVFAFALDATTGRPAPGLTVSGVQTLPPVNPNLIAIYYDQGSNTILLPLAPTGSAGLAVLPDLAPGSLSFNFVPPASSGRSTTSVVGLSTVAGAVTVAFVPVH
jgi:hypothetical protein